MTEEQRAFIEKQLLIIQAKVDEDELRRYETLLSMAKLKKEVSNPLLRATEMRRQELNHNAAMVVDGDYDNSN